MRNLEAQNPLARSMPTYNTVPGVFKSIKLMPNYQEKGGRFQFIPISFAIKNKNDVTLPRAEHPASYNKKASPSCSIGKWDVV